jgi:hypothetical protein
MPKHTETEWGPMLGKPGCLVPAAIALNAAADRGYSENAP